jgi:hypothetical protein
MLEVFLPSIGIEASSAPTTNGMAARFHRFLPIARTWIVALIALLLVGCGNGSQEKSDSVSGAEAARRTVQPVEPNPTFNKHIAPIVFKNCVGCHRAGQSAPFPLLNYPDVVRHSKQIVKVTESGVMPPWLPSERSPRFKGERRISETEKELIRNWVNSGCPEGDVYDPTPAPQFKDGWLLGTPDLVVKMPRAYSVGPEGPDIYRNFVVPLELDRDHYVRAVEFSPGNARIVHHAFIKVDRNRAARLLDGQNGEVGFPGMAVAAEMPSGQFLTWHPGETASESPSGLPWELKKGSDLVLQMHLNRSGKPEELQSSIAFYFTDRPPTNACVKISLASFALDFPAGATNVVVTDEYVLPADVQLLAILPHAHYLARHMSGFATLPHGEIKTLIDIPNWDFRWQTSYRYESPLKLPKGTTLHLAYAYDNSTNNVSNPNNPPKRVMYGAQSSDEMCELWLQLLADTPAQANLLVQDHGKHLAQRIAEGARSQIQVNPNSAAPHAELGALLMWKDPRQADYELARAIQLDPNLAVAHFQRGVLFRSQGRFPTAKKELEEAIRLDPNNGQAFGNLGFVLAELGDGAGAESCFLEALRIDPSDSVVEAALAELRAALHK